MKLNQIMRRGWYLAEDDGAANSGAPDQGAAAGGGDDAAAAAATQTLTAEQIEERAYAATQRALNDVQAQHDERARQAQATAQQSQRWNPAADAMEAIDIRTEMFEDALALYPDLPKDAQAEIKAKLRDFKSAESLRSAKDKNLHELIADSVYGKAVRTGKIQPKTVEAPSREPAYSEPDIKVPAGLNNELNELEALLGVKYTDAERREFARSSGGYN